MKRIIFYLVITCIAITNQAQNLIAVQNGDIPAFYYSLDSAIIHAQNGDTIYLPGGYFSGNVQINKQLHIVGTGHHPDSSRSTIETSINGSMHFKTGSGNGSLTGLLLNASLTFEEAVTNYSFRRCRLINGCYFYQEVSYFKFIENIIEGAFMGPDNGIASNFSFYNNIVTACFWNTPDIKFHNCIYKNNVFLRTCTYAFTLRTQYSTLDNNIFIAGAGWLSAENCILRNNLFVEQYVVPVGGGTGNITGFQGQVFINQTGYNFDYSHDYHLAPDCPGNNAGTDGTDMGIFGGIFPWKEGSIPQNPHIKFKNISGATDQNGNINVTIRVAAQDN